MKTKVQFFDVDNYRKTYEFPKNGVFMKIENLGEGSFSKVIKVEKKDITSGGDSKYFAIKISKRFKIKQVEKNKKSEGCNLIGSKRLLNKKDDEKKDNSYCKDSYKMRDFNFVEIREIEIMRSLNHPNLLKILEFGIEKNSKELWILLDYFPTNIGKFFNSYRK